MRRDLLLSASLLSVITCAGAAETAPATPAAPLKPTFVTGEQSIALDAGDLKAVAKGRFYVSRDQGKTWTLAQETAVDPAAPKAPVFAFRPQGDGAYYIVTSTVYRDGHAEVEPAPNTVPAKALLLVVDTTPPVVATLEAVTHPVTDPAATSVDVDVTWTITDTNFASATLEQSLDGGASFAAAQAVAATGSAKLTLPRTKDNTVQLRIVAKDAAGNQAPSLAKVVTLPLPPDPEKALVAAVSSLPTLAEVQPPPEIAALPASSTAAAVAPAGAADPSVPAVAATPAAPVVPAASAVTNRPVNAPTGVPFLLGKAADDALAKARELRDAKEVDGAHSAYLRLQESSVAKVAVAEDLVMLRTAGDHAAVVGVAEGVEPQLRTDTVRLEHGKALLAIGKPADAEQVLRTVRKGADEAREALLFIGKAAFAQGKIAVSTKIYEKLAAGDDAVAAEAKLLRGK
jgi:hypothetical protein